MVDAIDSKSIIRKDVEVRVLSPAQKEKPRKGFFFRREDSNRRCPFLTSEATIKMVRLDQSVASEEASPLSIVLYLFNMPAICYN